MSQEIHYSRPFEPRPHFRRWALALALLGAVAGVSTTFARDDGKEQGKNEREEREKNERKERERKGPAHGRNWRMIGHDSTNTRNQPFERTIGPANVSHLSLKWTAMTAGDVSATPAVVNGAVYFGDFGGTLWKLDAETGHMIWSHKVPDYTGNAGDYARTSPSLAGNTLVVGDLKHPDMLGIDATDGRLLWRTQVHPDPKGIMTGSPVLAGNTIYTGVSASGPAGPGATFRDAFERRVDLFQLLYIRPTDIG